MNVLLRPLTINDEKAFLEGVKLWDGHSLSWYTFGWTPGSSFRDLLDRLDKDSKGRDLQAHHVPSTMLYGFLGEVIIGRLHVRHILNESLLRRGGNIGYAVAPAFRGRRFATEMMAQGLEYCRGLGLKRVLVTCTDSNVPSWKIIEHFGGQLESTIYDEDDGQSVRRYWIEI